MTCAILQRRKAYLETARALLRAAHTLTDRVIADQLKAFADDYQQQAGNDSRADATNAFARSAANSDVGRRTSLDGSFTLHAADDMPGDNSSARSSHELFVPWPPSVPARYMTASSRRRSDRRATGQGTAHSSLSSANGHRSDRDIQP